MRSVRILASLIALVCAISAAGIAAADEVSDGKVLFMQYCAGCHGPTGVGDGPQAAKLLPMKVANLQLLSQRYGNPLPKDKIAGFISGRFENKSAPSHGLPAADGNANKNKQIVADLIAFLQSIQLPTHSAAN